MTISGFYSLATPLHLLMPLQSVSPNLPPSSPLLPLLQHSSYSTTTITTPSLQPPTPHPRLLLCMNNAGGLLDSRYQHAMACFIHTKVRQISPRHCLDPWAACLPACLPSCPPSSKTSVCLLAPSPWPSHLCRGQRTQFLMEAQSW